MDFQEGVHKSELRGSMFKDEPELEDSPGGGRSKRVRWLLALLIVLVVGGGLLGVQAWRSSRQTQKVAPPPQIAWCAVPNTPPSFTSSISGLAKNDIWAISAGQVIHWNGTIWGTPAQYRPVAQSFVSKIVEVARNDVWVVGQYVVKEVNLPANGTPTPGPGKQISYTNTLIMHWDGKSWQVVPSPNGGSNGTNDLLSISAVSTNDIWALGFSSDPYYNQGVNHSGSLIEHWDGQSWNLVPYNLGQAQSAAGKQVFLYDIKALSSKDVWAVGVSSSMNGGHAQPEIEHWDETSWQAVPSPNLDAQNPSFLRAIDGSSANDLWAVGMSGLGTASQGETMLIEHWDGAKWSLTPNPALPPSHENYLAGVAVASPTQAWAVGSLAGNRPLIEFWDGHKWQIAPNHTTLSGHLEAITLIGHQPWAVGFPPNGSAPDDANNVLIETICS